MDYIKQRQEYSQKILENNRHLDFGDLHIYFTDEVSEERMSEVYLPHYVEAYILSNYRLSLLGKEIFSFEDLDTKNKKVEVFITTEKQLYRSILYECGMKFVTEENLRNHFGFISGGVNIVYMDREGFDRWLPPKSSQLDSLAHEFTHILFHQYLNIKPRVLNKYWNNVLDEGFPVILNNQYGYIYNLKKNLASNTELDLKKISYRYLKKNGYFTIDNRGVLENYEYQYSAALVERIDGEIRKIEEYKSSKPLSGLFKFIRDNSNKEIFVEEDLMNKLGIDIKKIEKDLRKEIGIKD